MHFKIYLVLLCYCEKYVNYILCHNIYVYNGPQSLQTIEVEFDGVDISCYRGDYITITDTRSGETLLAKVCGRGIPDPVLSVSTSITITFKAHKNNRNKYGFQLSFASGKYMEQELQSYKINIHLYWNIIIIRCL